MESELFDILDKAGVDKNDVVGIELKAVDTYGETTIVVRFYNIVE